MPMFILKIAEWQTTIEVSVSMYNAVKATGYYKYAVSQIPAVFHSCLRPHGANVCNDTSFEVVIFDLVGYSRGIPVLKAR